MRREVTLPTSLTEAPIVTLSSGDTVFQAGDACANFLFVLSGSVRVDLIGIGGKTVLLYRIGNRQSCVMTTSCLMSKKDYSAEATAETDVIACMIPAKKFNELLSQSEEFRELVFDAFADRLGAMMGKVEEVAFGSIDRRLARRLIDRQKQGLGLEITHEQLAIDLGSSREVVSRKLARWDEAGLIIKSHRAIEILDTKRIQQMAEDCD